MYVCLQYSINQLITYNIYSTYNNSEYLFMQLRLSIYEKGKLFVKVSNRRCRNTASKIDNQNMLR